MSRILKEQDLVNVIYGATVLGAGGGGSATGGMDLLNKYKEMNPCKPIELTLLDPKEMDDDAYAAITAGMGSPKALLGKDFTPYAVNSFEALVDMAAKMGRKLKYCCAVEMGGFNTFVPMLISLLKGIPFIDADGAARAVPALDTLLLHVNGLDTSPLAMADHKNNRLEIVLADARDANKAQRKARLVEHRLHLGRYDDMHPHADGRRHIRRSPDHELYILGHTDRLCRLLCFDDTRRHRRLRHRP